MSSKYIIRDRTKKGKVRKICPKRTDTKLKSEEVDLARDRTKRGNWNKGPGLETAWQEEGAEEGTGRRTTHSRPGSPSEIPGSKWKPAHTGQHAARQQCGQVCLSRDLCAVGWVQGEQQEAVPAPRTERHSGFLR